MKNYIIECNGVAERIVSASFIRPGRRYIAGRSMCNIVPVIVNFL